MHPHRRLTPPHWLVATDPGHARLINATAVAAGVAVSAAAAWSVVHFAHADHALMTMGAFLAMQLGFLVKGDTARARLITTLLLFAPIVAALSVATALSGSRPVEIAAFIGIAGAAVWLRRYGPRISAMGTVTFFSYFFALFLRPTWPDLPWFFLVAGCAVASIAAAHAVVAVADPPRRQLVTLCADLRATSAAAVKTAEAVGPGDDRTRLHAALDRADDVGRALNDWQHEHHAPDIIACPAPAFAALVLEARIDTEHACRALAATRRADPGCADSDCADSDCDDPAAELTDLNAVLHPHSTAAQVAAAGAAAERRLSGGPVRSDAAVGIDRATSAHAALRGVDLSRPWHPAKQTSTTAATAPATSPSSAPAPSAPASSATPSPTPAAPAPSDGHGWSRWRLTSRMAIQVVAATTLATVAGEAISASRWYWAVLTAFIVFAGANSRGALLTRASRRLEGTLAGVLVGFGLALLIDGNAPVLIAASVLGVFAMVYFGPLQYAVQVFFVTVFLCLMYGLLGVLNRQILELRLTETAVGAAVGVVCAYLIFSTSSRPNVLARLGAYFDAVDQLLGAVRTALTSPGDAGPSGEGPAAATPGSGEPVIDAVAGVESAAAALTKELDAMAISLLTGRRSLNSDLENLMTTATRMAAGLGRATIGLLDDADARRTPAGIGPRYAAAVAQVLAASQTARAALVDGHDVVVDADATGIAEHFSDLALVTPSPQQDVVSALTRLDWALHRAVALRAAAE